MEFLPTAHRLLGLIAFTSFFTTGLMMECLIAYLLSDASWRVLTAVSLAPVLLSLMLLPVWPESPRFLARRPQRWGELGRLLGRMQRPMPEGARYTDSLEQAREKRAGFRALFDLGYGRDTVAVWVAFFMCLTAVYSAFSWLPTMLQAEGLSLAVAGSGLTAYNLGGVIGALVCAVAMTRWGSYWPLLLCCLGGAASAFATQLVDVNQHASLLIFGFGVLVAVIGFAVNREKKVRDSS